MHACHLATFAVKYLYSYLQEKRLDHICDQLCYKGSYNLKIYLLRLYSTKAEGVQPA